MGMINQGKQLLKLRKEAKQVQKKLKNIHIEADEGPITITISAEQEVLKLTINDDSIPEKDRKKLEKYLVAGFNKALKKSQSVAADNMKDLLGGLGGGLDGLLGK